MSWVVDRGVILVKDRAMRSFHKSGDDYTYKISISIEDITPNEPSSLCEVGFVDSLKTRLLKLSNGPFSSIVLFMRENELCPKNFDIQLDGPMLTSILTLLQSCGKFEFTLTLSVTRKEDNGRGVSLEITFPPKRHYQHGRTPASAAFKTNLGHSNDLLLTAGMKGTISLSIILVIKLDSDTMTYSHHIRRAEITKADFCPMYAALGEKLLSSEETHDVTLVSSSGKEYRCHKLLLTGTSAVFATMLKDDNFKEGRCGRIVVDDLSDACVEAFLAHIYCDSEKIMRLIQEFVVAFELLTVAERYNMCALKNVLEQHMLSHDNNWFPPDGLLLVYSFSRGVSGLTTLKCRSAGILKSKYNQICQEKFFLDWFSKSPEAALELFNLALKNE